MHYLINLNNGMKSDTIITTMLQMRNLRLNKAKLLAYPRSDTVEHLLDAMHYLITLNNGMKLDTIVSVGFEPRSNAHTHTCALFTGEPAKRRTQGNRRATRLPNTPTRVWEDD